jgi:DDE superfamily endonuclease
MEHRAQSSEARFAEYVDSLAAVLGRDDRAQPLKDYCTGLLMPSERKSVEPMAAVVASAHVSAKHQSLLHLWQGGLVGRSGSGQSARTRPAGSRSAGQDRGSDRRRHRFRQEGRS